MDFDFSLILLIITAFTGAVTFVFVILNYFNHNKTAAKPPAYIRWSRDFFPVFLIVFIIRSFGAQIYHVPTGSLQPSVLPGDLVLATQYSYGLHFPVWNYKFMSIGHPKRGDIVLFPDPVSPKNILIKRVIGLPGDRISYINKILTINGQVMQQKLIGNGYDLEGPEDKIEVKEYLENLDGVTHKIFLNPQLLAQDFYNLVVPKGSYFVMGDNRDDSDDSRYWGFVRGNSIFAKGEFIILSWNHFANKLTDKIRWHNMFVRLF